MTQETPLDRLYLSARTLAIIWACGVSFAGGLVALSELDDTVRHRGRIVDRIKHIDAFALPAEGRVAVIDGAEVRYYPDEAASAAFGTAVSTREEALRAFDRGVQSAESRMLGDGLLGLIAAALGGSPIGLVVGGRRWWRWLQTGSTAAR